MGRVAVPDPRLDTLARLGKSQRVVPTSLEFVDIAGLVRGASRGEGLGNQFLANIREVDAIIHVLRCFEDPNVVHVEGGDRKSTRLNSSHANISYAVFCLKKKKEET